MFYKIFVRGPSTGGFDLDKFEQVTAGQQVYIPISAPQFVERTLEARGQVMPSYFSYTMNAESIPGIQRKLNEMHQAEFVLLPLGSLKYLTTQPVNNWSVRIYRLGYKYPKDRPFFNTGELIADDVRANYDPVQVFGTEEHEQFTLYRRKHTPDAPPTRP